MPKKSREGQKKGGSGAESGKMHKKRLCSLDKMRIDGCVYNMLKLYYNVALLQIKGPQVRTCKEKEMKALKRIGALLLSMLIVLSSFAISVLAEEHDHSAKPLADEVQTDAKCGEGTAVNVAKNATVIGDRGPGTVLGEVFWSVFDHYWCVVDGDEDTYCPVDTTHWNPYGLWINLDDSYDLSKIVIQTNGIGRSPSSKGASDQLIDRKGEFPLHVSLYNLAGTEIYSQKITATGENIEIDIANTDIDGRIHKIYLYVEKAYVTSVFQGIWEVEAWTNDIHDWQDVEVVAEANCSSGGIMAVRCADCGDEKESYTAQTAHTDTCKGYCDVCGAWLEKKHEGANGCLSTECAKCGEEIDSSSHAANPSNPCDTTCSKCGMENVIDVTGKHVANQDDPCSNDCGRCGAKDVIPDAYDVAKSYNIYLTHKAETLPYVYARHVANPDNPCDTTCSKCQKVEAVAAAHTPGAETGTWAAAQNDGAGVTINPCSSKQCAECGEPNAYPVAPHIIVDDPNGTVAPNGKTYYPCSKTCKKCWSYFARWYSHEFDDCGDEYCNVCNSYIAIAERAHSFTEESPVMCEDCGYAIACPGHKYDGPCDGSCNYCGQKRYGWRDSGLDYWHIYVNSCDTTCNDCNATRTIEHKYPTAACGELCTVCGVKRTTETPHTYPDIKVNGETLVGSNACNPLCSECNETREVEHTYAYVCAPVCSLCKTPHAEAATLHVWDGPCDTRCNNVGCTETRVAAHEWDNACDTTCNVTGCGYVREITHSYTSVCDTTCDICQHARTDASAHKYTNACDATCNNTGCDYTRTAETDDKYDPDHEYETACGTICKICGASRTVEHVYDNACDNSCNKCGVPNPNFAAHDYGEWVTTVEPTEETEGVQTRTCKVCGVADSETQVLPKVEPERLGTGAVIGIVSGSVVVVGGGGFSLWWFVIRKKFLKG